MTPLQILQSLKKTMERNLRMPIQAIIPEIEKAMKLLEEESEEETQWDWFIFDKAASDVANNIDRSDMPVVSFEETHAAVVETREESLEELQKQYVEKTGKQLSIRYKNDRERILSKLYPQVTND